MELDWPGNRFAKIGPAAGQKSRARKLLKVVNQNGGWKRRTNSVHMASSFESRQSCTNSCGDSFRGSICEVGWWIL